MSACLSLSMSGVPCGGHGRGTVERVCSYVVCMRAASEQRVQRALGPRESCIIAKRSGSNVERAVMRRRRFDPSEESRNRAWRVRSSSSVPTCSCVLAAAVGRLGASIGSDQRSESRFHRASQPQLQSLSVLHFLCLSCRVRRCLSLSLSLSPLFFAVGFCGDLA